MFHNLFAATALASLFSLSGAGILQAADTSAPLVLQPLEAMNVAAGQTKTVGYFLAEDARCKLVVTTAIASDWSKQEAFSVIRFEAAIPAGRSTCHTVSDGHALEFKCLEGGRSLVVENADNALASISP